jgi:hypothetical protein
MGDKLDSGDSWPLVSLMSENDEIPTTQSHLTESAATVQQSIAVPTPIRPPQTLPQPADAVDLLEPTFSGLVRFSPQEELSCWQILSGLFCDFENTVYAATRRFDRELTDGTAQIHSCLGAFKRTCCGCEDIYD